MTAFLLEGRISAPRESAAEQQGGGAALAAAAPIQSQPCRQARIRHVDEQYSRSLRVWLLRNQRPQFGAGHFAHPIIDGGL